jgi:ribosomal protein S19
MAFYLKKGNIILISNFITFTFFMYTGKKFIEFLVDINHVGFRLGHFIFTRKMGFIHKTAKKKKKNKLKRKK